MKKTISLLVIAMVALSSLVSAQSMLDSTMAGYENTSTNFKKAFSNDLWYGNFTDSAFFVTDVMSFAGDYSLCFRDTLSALRKANGDIDIKKVVYFSYFPITGDTLYAGSYKLSQKVFLATGNTMKRFFTEIGSPIASSVEWDIEESPRNEWVTLEKSIIIANDLDVRGNNGKAARLITRIPADTLNNDLQLMYVDDHQLMLDTATTEEYKVGNLFDESYFGFENCASAATDGWYPQKNKGADHFDFTMDNAASGDYSLRLKVDAGDAAVPTVLKVQGSLSEGSSTTITSGVYDMYMKVFIDENSSIQSINTNWSANKDADKNDIPNPFTPMAWDLSDVKKGEWVELHRVDTLPAYDRAKVTVQLVPDSMDFSTNDVEVYFDDLAIVHKADYTFVPMVKISTPTADSVFATTDVTVKYAIDEFYLKFDGIIKYSIDSETPVYTDTKDSIVFAGLSNGAHAVTVELVGMDSASFTPAVSDVINFSVASSSDIQDNEEAGVTVYPNPAQDVITIEGQQGETVTFYSLVGAVVKSTVLTSDFVTLDVSNLPSGSYLVQVGAEVVKVQIN